MNHDICVHQVWSYSVAIYSLSPEISDKGLSMNGGIWKYEEWFCYAGKETGMIYWGWATGLRRFIVAKVFIFD